MVGTSSGSLAAPSFTPELVPQVGRYEVRAALERDRALEAEALGSGIPGGG